MPKPTVVAMRLAEALLRDTDFEAIKELSSVPSVFARALDDAGVAEAVEQLERARRRTTYDAKREGIVAALAALTGKETNDENSN